MKILILVLSARREPWGSLMDVSMETWDAEDNPQTQTIYYCGSFTESAGTDEVFYSRIFDESLEGVSGRTIEAFEHALNFEWDYLARPNSSCYVHKKALVYYCATLPEEGALYGLLTGGEAGQRMLWGGGQYIMSRDVVEKLVANKDKWDFKLMDDQSLTKMAEKLAIPMFGNSRCASINDLGTHYFCMLYGHGHSFHFEKFDQGFANQVEGHFFFRVKQDLRRHKDLEIIRALKGCLP